MRNWRPISLQLTCYKLYAAIIARRIASWATETSSFSWSQKGFLAYDGCSEHNFLLRSILGDSRRKKRNVILAWLDIKEAFPSISHHLMLFLMERLGLSGALLRVVEDIYSDATIAVKTGRDSYTPKIPQQRGVKQGCPLSPILFNSLDVNIAIRMTSLIVSYVFNYGYRCLLVAEDSPFLKNHTAKYRIGNTTVNALAYADDVCVVAANKEEMQDLLDRLNQSPRIYVDSLFTPRLGEEEISALAWEDRYRYLGCPTGAFRTKEQDLNTIRGNLIRDTITIIKSPLAEWQKVDVFRRFLFPRLTFILQVIIPGSTWCRKLDTTLRGAFKQGLKLPRRTATQYFYLPQALGGLGIPSVEDEAHIARAAQAFKFLGDTRDSVIREVALQQLSETVTKRARRLDPNKLEDLAEFLNTSAAPGEGRAGDLQSLWSSARASLVAGGAAIEITQDSAILHTSKHNIPWHKRKQAFQAMREEVGQRHLRNIKRSSDQGRAFDSLSLHPDSTFFTYTGAFLSFYQYRFIHKARLNLLPMRIVQARCHRPVPSTLCRHSGRDQETLAHILNHYHQNLGMTPRNKTERTPIPGTSGANRPDLTIISPDKSTIILVEVCCPFEGSPTALEDAARLKVDKYEPLRQTLLQSYTSVEVLPFIVGSLGSWYPPTTECCPDSTSDGMPCVRALVQHLTSLRRHVKKSRPAYLYQELFACDVCGYETETLKSVNSHVKTQHGTVNPPEAPNGAFQCPHCVMRRVKRGLTQLPICLTGSAKHGTQWKSPNLNPRCYSLAR
eukprot:Em0054g27a